MRLSSEVWVGVLFERMSTSKKEFEYRLGVGSPRGVGVYATFLSGGGNYVDARTYVCMCPMVMHARRYDGRGLERRSAAR